MPVAVNTEQFVQLFVRHEQQVYRYIYGLLPNAADAQEVMQETAVAIWRRFSDFDPSQSFLAWACGFARYEVLNHYRRQRRRPAPLQDDVLEQLAGGFVDRIDELNRRRAALDDCVDKLPDKERRLIEVRYGGQRTVREMAASNGASEHTLYKALERIRRALFDCVTRTLAAGEVL